MPDLSSIKKSEIQRLIIEIKRIRRGKTGTYAKPHKLIMLLAIIDMANAGFLQENKIYFEEPLIGYFEKNFRLFCKQKDWCQPSPPFFHLRSSNFWFHKPKAGREEIYKSLNTSGGGSKRILENIEYAYLSDYAFKVLSNGDAREEVKKNIISLLQESSYDET